MNILMMTNTYKPLMGGLEKSVEAFTLGYRERGHRVIIVAPEFEDMRPERDVIRIPAIQHFNGTDFSVQLPVPGVLSEALGDFRPGIVHSHHPFLVGDTAVRLAYKFNVPLVFTHHTLYEQNTHYVPAGDTTVLKNFVIQLSAGYANLADQVFAPSESVMDLLRQRGVTTPIDIVPTGIDVKRFAAGDPRKLREALGIRPGAFVIGHLGRLAPEKNLEFLAKAVLNFMASHKEAQFLMVGKGPSEEVIENMFREAGLGGRLHLTGPLTGQDLVDAYHVMDVFVFASQSETQGLVLAETMAAGVPIVAVDAPGVREVVKDEVNGRLLMREDAVEFAGALEWMAARGAERTAAMKKECRETAAAFSMEKCLDQALRIYDRLVKDKLFVRRHSEDSTWEKTLRLLQAHWGLAKNLAKATKNAVMNPTPEVKKTTAIQDNTFAGPLV